MFSHCLHPSAQSSASSSQHIGVTGHDRLTADAREDVDVALKNLVGDGAEDAAQRWADHGKLLEKLAIVRDYLGKGEHDVLDKLLSTDEPTRLDSGEKSSDHPEERTFKDKGKMKERNVARYYALESEEDTDLGDSDDERGRTAHKLFASLAGIDEDDKENKWWLSSPSSQTAAQNVDISQELLNAVNQRREEPVGDGAWRVNCLTPVVSSPIRVPVNESGSKSCNITPRQSQLGGSLRKKVTAKNKTSPSTPGTPIPSLSITRSTGAVVRAGHSFASPICLLSSSPVVSPQGGRQTSEQIKPSAGLSHVARTLFPNHHSLNLINEEFKSIPVTDIAPSSAQHLVLETSQKRRRKHEGPFFTPINSKKRHRTASTVDTQAGIMLHEIDDVVVSSSVVSSKGAMGSNQETRIHSGESPIRTEREKLALKRMDIAQQLANTYPHLAAPSYEKKRAKQLAKLMGKKRGRAGADATSTKQKLVQTQTIFSFETVDDDDGGMDWNRSKKLADDLRDAVTNGRRPVIPSLKCAQSPSPSTKN